MAVLRFFPFLLLLFCFGCAKLGYLIEQGKGQLRIQWGAEKNETVLNDPDVKDEHKEKIRLIQKYKKYFYAYFEEKETSIYTKTYFLKDDAVSYLVIASPYDKIKPLHFSFPIVGTFPYIGFFNLDSAREFKSELEEDGYVTYMRPVFAYSTLMYLEDRILSSFFHYSETELAELIFHELFHTIYFIKNEVGLNENLATYFSEQMLAEYFHWDEKKVKERDTEMLQISAVRLELKKWVKEINERLKKLKPQNKFDANLWLKDLVETEMKPALKSVCEAQKIPLERCYPLGQEWNQARLAASMTYESEQDIIGVIRKKHNLSLKGLLKHLRARYDDFKETPKNDLSFLEFLKNKENIKD